MQNSSFEQLSLRNTTPGQAPSDKSDWSVWLLVGVGEALCGFPWPCEATNHEWALATHMHGMLRLPPLAALAGGLPSGGTQGLAQTNAPLLGGAGANP